MSAPSAQDFVAGIDLTGSVTVTAAQLTQLIQSGTPFTDKGLIIATIDVAGNPVVPDASATTKWKNYIWLRIGAVSVIIYVWNDAAAPDATLLYWQNQSQIFIAPNSITAAMLQAGCVGDNAVSNISASKITGLPVAFPPNGAAGGDLTGTYPNPTVGNNAITATKLSSDAALDANRAVGNNHIKTQIINPVGADGKILVFGTAYQFLRVNAGATALEAATSYFTQLATLGTALQQPRVNAGATAVEWFTPTFTKAVYSALSAATLSDAAVTNSGAANYAGVFAHGLGAVPTYAKFTFVCTSNDATTGYTAGDEYQGSMIIAASGTPVDIGLAIDATNLTIVFSPVSGNGIRIMKKDGSSVAALTYADWKFKVYATL